jgi:hypothetical protein
MNARVLVVALVALSGPALAQLRPGRVAAPPAERPRPQSIASGGDAFLEDVPDPERKSEFAAWWNAASSRLPEVIRDQCKDAQVTATVDNCTPADSRKLSLADWCRCYASVPQDSPLQFDVAKLVSEGPLAAAAFLGRREELMQPLRRFAQLVADKEKPRLKPLQEKADAAAARCSQLENEREASASFDNAKVKELTTACAERTATRDRLDEAGYSVRVARESAMLSPLKNAGVLSQLSVAQGLAVFGLDEEKLRQIAEGLALALRERAEQEGVAAILDEVDRRLCTGPNAVKNKVAEWLPNTCKLAAQKAFGGSRGSGGNAAIIVLKRAIEEDLRAIPGLVAYKGLQSCTADETPAGQTCTEAQKFAQPVRQLSNAVLLQGVHPVRALDTFSRQLVPLIPQPDQIQRFEVPIAACAASMPASAAQYGRMVDDAMVGLDRPFDEPTKGFVVLLLGLEREGCNWLYPDAGASHFREWQESLSPLRTAAFSLWTTWRELDTIAKELAEASKLSRAPAAPSPASLIAAAEKISDEDEREKVLEAINATANDEQRRRLLAVAALVAKEALITVDAVETSADLVFRLRGRSIPDKTEADKTQKAAFEGQRKRFMSGIESSRSILRMATAAIAVDLSGLYQGLLRHAKVGDAECQVQPCLVVAPEVIQYGGLLVALGDAQSPEEVKSVILAAAAPVGSWRMKFDKDAGHSLTLGGLVGFGGALRNEEVQPRVQVPLGVDWVLAPDVLFGNVTLFVQVFDLAGYANFSGSSRSAPRLLEAVSPGVNLKFGLGESPFAIALGGAYDVDAGGKKPRGTARANFALVIDTTLFVLYRD